MCVHLMLTALATKGKNKQYTKEEAFTGDEWVYSIDGNDGFTDVYLAQTHQLVYVKYLQVLYVRRASINHPFKKLSSASAYFTQLWEVYFEYFFLKIKFDGILSVRVSCPSREVYEI